MISVVCVCQGSVGCSVCVYSYTYAYKYIQYGGHCINPSLSNQPHVSSCYSSILTFYGINAPFEWHPFSLQSLIRVKNKTYYNISCSCDWNDLCHAHSPTTLHACPQRSSMKKRQITTFQVLINNISSLYQSFSFPLSFTDKD